MDQVEKADRGNSPDAPICYLRDTPEQRKIQHRLAERFQKMGAMTSELSKKNWFRRRLILAPTSLRQFHHLRNELRDAHTSETHRQ